MLKKRLKPVIKGFMGIYRLKIQSEELVENHDSHNLGMLNIRNKIKIKSRTATATATMRLTEN
jgi:hypothetical protein